MSVFDTIMIGKPWPEKISIAGLALDDSKNRLYAVTKENNSLYVVDTKSKKIIWQYRFGGEGYTCIFLPIIKHFIFPAGAVIKSFFLILKF